MEWWQWLLIALLFVVGGAYAVYHALGREALLKMVDRYTPNWLRARLGWETTPAVTADKQQGKAAAPGKLPPAAKRPSTAAEEELSGDSSTAAQESLKRCFKRMR